MNDIEKQIPFDPDFDEADHAEEAVGGNHQFGLTSKQAFVAGLVASVLAIGTLGFVILIVKIFYS